MSRFQTLSPETATGKTRQLLEEVDAKLGLVPNMVRAMANAPAVLEGYLHLSTSLQDGALTVRQRQQIALAVSEANHCDYCLAVHTALAEMVGLTADQIRDSRHGTAVDAKTETLLRFARKLVDLRGQVNVRDVAEVRAAGFSDAMIAELVANVALCIFSNYFNHVAGTVVDFPKAPELDAIPAKAS